MLDNETKRRIDTARDILVGKVPDPKSQVEQITIALVYKFMDDMDKESVEMGGKASFFTGDYERYAWSKIFDPRIGGHEMLGLYGEAIVKLNQNPNIPQLFRDIFKNAYLPYRDPETLKLFLKTINEFTYDHSERLGDAFEYLLSVLGSQGDAGQFRTPRHIIDFMVQIVNPQKHEQILDPACGTAGFLISSYKHILKENTKKIPGDLLTGEERKKLLTNFKGYDISPDMVRLSLVNLYLHGFVQPQIIEYDTLTSEERWNEYADVIMANPPFMSPKGGIKPHKKFSVQSNRSEVLFVDYIAEHLTPTGRAAVIVPEGIIFQIAGAYKQLRKMLVENQLYAVVSLPAGIFNPYSGVKTSILLMDRQIAKKCDSILFVKIENDGFGLGAQRREQTGSDLPDAVNVLIDYIAATRNNKPETFVAEEKPCSALLVKKDKLSENGEYNLTGDRYRTVEKRKHHKWPMVNLGEVAKFKQGKQVDKDLHITEGKEGYTRFIRIIDYTQDNTDIRYIPTPTGDVFCNEKDLIMVRYGRPGLVGRGINGVFANNLFKIDFQENEKISLDFAYYILNSETVQKYIKRNLQVAGLPAINHSIVKQIKIPLPPIEVQREIVSEIEGYQKLIDGCYQVVESWKPQIEIDPEWPIVKLGEVCVFSQGVQVDLELQSKEYKENHVPFLRIENYTQNSEDIRYIPSELGRDKFVKKDEVVVVRYGASAGFIGRGIEGILANNLFKVSPDGRVLNSFLFYFLSSGEVQQYLKNITAGGAMPALSFKTVEVIQIPIPSLQDQDSIVSKIEAERKIIDGCRELFTIYEDKIKRVIDKVWEE